MRNNPKTAEEMYSDTPSSCMSYSDFLFKQNEDLRKQTERLQEQLESDEMALTESQEIIAELKAQLNEANEVIKKYRRFEVALKVEKGTLTGVYPAFDYLKKWGVK